MCISIPVQEILTGIKAMKVKRMGKMTENEMINNAMPICLYHLNDKYSPVIKKALEEIQQYRAIGTLEECRVAVEKQIPKKYVWRKQKWYRNGKIAYKCCGSCQKSMVTRNMMYCTNCGQKLDWSD